MPFPLFTCTAYRGRLVLRGYALLSIGAALLVLCSCCGSSPEGDDWLIVLDGDTVTVREAGTLWNSLGPSERQRFLTADDTVGDFIVTLARREMVAREMNRLGYSERPEVIYLAGARVRRNIYSAAVDSARAGFTRSVSGEDIDFYRSMMGRTVWYTAHPGTDRELVEGPVHLPEVPDRQLALCLDTLDPGETALCQGVPVRLDSLYATDPELVAQTLRDTARVAGLARNRIAEIGLRSLRDSLMEWALDSAFVDTQALESMATHIALGDFTPDSALSIVQGPVESWTQHKLMVEVSFASETRPVDPASGSWLLFFVRNLLLQNAYAHWFSGQRPEAVESLMAGGQAQRRSRALDLMFNEMVAESVSVDRAEIEQRYASLSEPVMIPERRRLSIVVFPREEIEEFRRLTEDTTRSPVDVFDPYPWFRDSTLAQTVTLPVRRTQLPAEMAESAFSMDAADTTHWIGPLPVPQLELMAAFRLREVLPAREATIEEASDSLSAQIRREKSQSRLEQWMSGLEQRYRLRLNEGILDRLPADPALWSRL